MEEPQNPESAVQPSEAGQPVETTQASDLKASEPVIKQAPDKKKKTIKLLLLLITAIATLVNFILLFIPLCNDTFDYYAPIDVLAGRTFSIPLVIVTIVFFLACFAVLLSFVPSLMAFFKSERKFYRISQIQMYVTIALPLAYFITGYVFAILEKETTTVWVPLMLSVLIYIAYAALKGQIPLPESAARTSPKLRKKHAWELLIYLSLITAATFLMLALNVVKISARAGGYLQEVSLNGYELLTTYWELAGGFQVLAFVLMAVLLTSGTLFVLSLTSFLSKGKATQKLVKVSIFTNFICVMAVSLFGLYFAIAQKINEETLLSLLASYNVSVDVADYIGRVTSQTIYAFIISLAVLLAAVIRERAFASESEIALPAASLPDSLNKEEGAPAAPKANPAPQAYDFDACPAFSELDSKLPQFEAAFAQRQQQLFSSPSLPAVVKFVVDYARECRLHLSYSLEDMATFVAGLGASRLTILQGMSGTGKTSLPKIFAEAIMGNCEIVEVESSWRDKNELLGYYNEFSKCFTPKKFTQSLYRARLNSTVTTFIVLDEMNLSRIEYYFSDFLSLMEHEEDKREIKLLNVKLCNTVKGEAKPYLGLEEGHTVKIPSNVWFIGTANRDESTFEISDKVYDRAQTMDFNKRAPKIRSFREPLPQRFVPSDMLTALFEQAKGGVKFEAEDDANVRAVEKLLAPYNISFGNRILKQMEEFVKIYCACFDSVTDDIVRDAVDRILLSKVVRKLETKIVTDKQAIVSELNRLHLPKCSEFAQKLNED